MHMLRQDRAGMHSVSRTAHPLAEAGADASSLKASEFNFGADERFFRSETFLPVMWAIGDRSASVSDGCGWPKRFEIDGADFEGIRTARIVGEPKPIRRKHAVISDDLHGKSFTLLRSVANQRQMVRDASKKRS